MALHLRTAECVSGTCAVPSCQEDTRESGISNAQVSSTLSQLPPIPPRSPSGVSATSTAAFSIPSTSPQKSLAPASLPNLPTRYISASPPSSSAGGVLVLPDGTTLATGDNGGRPERDPAPSTSMMHAVAHSSPNSPWSLLTVHVLPVFAGSPLRTPIEDLK